VPFLIGCGSVKKNSFQIRQYFLPDYSDEEAMLEAVREEIKEKTVIVSYNGKSFDLPILNDRLIIQRVERNLTFDDHIDLLHTARRMYRRRLKDCTLTNIEREILDFYRIDDIPGSMVPAMYFAWLNYDETENLKGVVEHNLYDIISLFFLMHHFSSIQTDPDEKISEPDDVLSLAKIIQSSREHENVYKILEKFENISESYNRNDIIYMQSMAYKRSGEFNKAALLWEKIAEDETLESFLSQIELAKYYEHRIKDFNKAIDYSLQARKICPPRTDYKNDLEKRISRLKRKSAR
jgi:hypothetical protein